MVASCKFQKKIVKMKKTPKRIRGRSGQGSGGTSRQTTQTDKAPRKQLATKGEHSKCSKFLNEFFMQYTKNNCMKYVLYFCFSLKQLP